MHKVLWAVFSLLLVCCSKAALAQIQDDDDFAEIISKEWSNGTIQKPNAKFRVNVGSTGGNLVAYRINVPSGGWLNKQVYISCDKFLGDDSEKLMSANFEDGQFYELSGPFQFNYFDDTGSLEQNETPQFMIFAQVCEVKKQPESSVSPEIREQVLRNNLNVLRIGPTFTCPDIDSCDPLSQIVLTQRTRGFPIALLDVALVQAYQVLRAFPSTNQIELRVEANNFREHVKEFCRLRKRYTQSDVHGNLIVPTRDSACVADEYRRQRHKWTTRVVDMNNADASEEVRRPVEDHWFAQYLLVQRGFLSKLSVSDEALRPIDGSYGAETRKAIKAVQSSAGLSTSGFLNDATFRYLRNIPSKTESDQAALITNETPDLQHTASKQPFLNELLLKKKELNLEVKNAFEVVKKLSLEPDFDRDLENGTRAKKYTLLKSCQIVTQFSMINNEMTSQINSWIKVKNISRIEKTTPEMISSVVSNVCVRKYGSNPTYIRLLSTPPQPLTTSQSLYESLGSMRFKNGSTSDVSEPEIHFKMDFCFKNDADAEAFSAAIKTLIEKCEPDHNN